MYEKLKVKMRHVLLYILLASFSTIYGKRRGEGGKCNCNINPIDIGFGVDDNSLTVPGFAPFRYTKRATGHWGGENGPWYNYNEFASSGFVSTKVATPNLVKNGTKYLGNMPLSTLITKAILIDVSKEVGNNWNYKLPVSKLEEWVATNGPIPDNCLMIIRFGWWSRYPNKNQFFGPSLTDLRWPGLSKEAAQWIVNTGKVVGVGMDTATSTPGSELSSSPIEEATILSNDIYEIGKMNLESDLPLKFNIIVLPMKLTDGNAGPTRVIAYF